ncbi:hypothetical protein JXL83_02950 [candidate division WOR-3 bacterium]|nr:hypothetical protein [candidate division WOR-3 bacterium]
MKKHLLKIILPTFLFLSALSCASSKTRMEPLTRYMYRGEYSEALSVYDSLGIKDENAVSLDYANRGLLLHLSGRYEESNGELELAERYMDRILRSNFKQTVSSYIINEYSLPYSGEDYENIMVNFYKMFNYALLGLPEEALVECRRIDYKLNLLNDMYEGSATYTDDAFSRYMAGIFFESEKMYDDCFIEYFKSYRIYEDLYSEKYSTSIPSSLVESLKKAAVMTGRENDVPFLFREKTRPITSGQEADSFCEFIFILEAGQLPYKEEIVSYATLEDGKILSVALPVLIPAETQIFGGTMRTTDRYSEIEMVQNLGSIAEISLKDRGGRILARAVARAGLKYLAQQAGEKIGDEIADDDDSFLGDLFSGIIGIFSAATEHADLRGWTLLPDKIFLGRIFFTGADTVINVTIHIAGPGDISFVYPVEFTRGGTVFTKERIWF